MENFFNDDKFHSDVEDLIQDLFDGDENEVKNLPEDWTLKVELSEKEPIFKVDGKTLLELLCDCNEERLNEDFDRGDEERILKAINESCDFEKLKELLPKYYYPTCEFLKLTKKDLLDAI